MRFRSRVVVCLVVLAFVWSQPLSGQFRLPQLPEFANALIPQANDAMVGPIVAQLIDPNRQPITTSFADTRQGRTLPASFTPDSFGPLAALDRTPDAAFILQPGAWQGEVQSYCLHAGTHGPSGGEGYLPAPIQGTKAAVVRTILRQSAFHPEIPQDDIQALLWAILARADYDRMPSALQRTASTLLAPRELDELRGGPLALLPLPVREQLERKLEEQTANLSAPFQRVLRAESALRRQFEDGSPYQALEQTAVLTGVLPSGANRLAVSQVWIQHPHGFYVRYVPHGYQRTTLQIYVPQTAAASPAPLVFDPSEEIATPASTGRQRLGITARESDARFTRD